MADLFNNTSNPGVIDPSEDRLYIDSLKDARSQLREIMLQHYEPNKLKDQQEFNAIVLKQLDNKDKFFRVIARIPEIHCMLPIPKSENDARTISLYPTFLGMISDNSLGIQNKNALSPGAQIVVTFENMTNFSGPKVIRILNTGPTTVTTSSNDTDADTPERTATRGDDPKSKIGLHPIGDEDDEGLYIA